MCADYMSFKLFWPSSRLFENIVQLLGNKKLNIIASTIEVPGISFCNEHLIYKYIHLG